MLHASIRECVYPGADLPALSDVELEIHQGDFVVVTGPAASGKTTLCHCLTGAIPKAIRAHVDGEVEVDGRRLGNLPLPGVSPLVGMVMQSASNQLFCVTVREDVAFGPENLCLPAGEVRRRTEASMKFTSTDHLADRFSHLLSGGESQRVVLSSVVALEAGILVLDQPAAELDPVGRRQIYANIRRLNKERGKTIILVEDRLEEVLTYATRVLLLEGGRIVVDATPRDFASDDGLMGRGIRIPAAVGLYRELQMRGHDLGACPLSVEELTSAMRPMQPYPNHVTDLHDDSPKPPKPPPAPPAIELTNVTHRYPAGVEALHAVSLTVEQNGAVAIVGKNGAGKTTLAKHLIRLLRPSQGLVRILGQNMHDVPVHRVSQSVGYVFQDPDYQIFKNDCLEEAAYALMLRKIPVEEAHIRARDALERVGLRGMEEVHPYILSRGQRQMLAVASILAAQPPILVVDEPTTGLDYGESLTMMNVLRDYRRSGGTLVVITHDIEVAMNLGDRIVAMRDGRIVLDIPVSDVSDYLDELVGCGVLLPDLQVIVHELGLPKSVRTFTEAATAILDRVAHDGGASEQARR